jgi:ADP-ribose pyrophosphatase
MEIRILDEELLCKGSRVSLITRRFSLNNNILSKDVVLFGEAVAIVPVLNNDTIVMIRQYRVPIKQWIYEIPAGKIEKGEDPEVAAGRELIEETGYKAKHIEKLVSIYMSPGYSDEILHVFVASDLEFIGSRREPGEIMKVVKLRLNEALEKVLSQEISDSKTLISLLLYALKLKKLGQIPMIT